MVRPHLPHKVSYYLQSKRRLENKYSSLFRAEAWLLAIRRSDLLDANLQHRRVCSRHFAAEMYNCPSNPRSSILRESAIPSLCDENSISLSASTRSNIQVETRDVACQADNVAKSDCGSQTMTTTRSKTTSSQTPARLNPAKLQRRVIHLSRRLRAYKYRRNRRLGEIYKY